MPVARACDQGSVMSRFYMIAPLLGAPDLRGLEEVGT